MYSYECAPATIGSTWKWGKGIVLSASLFLKQKGSILIISTRKYSLFTIALTWTDHWCILVVSTVMHTPWIVSTTRNGTFISLTLNTVQPNLSTSLTKPCTVWSTDSKRIPKLTTDNSSIIFIPIIVTNSSPATAVIDLHSALSRPISPNQSQSC